MNLIELLRELISLEATALYLVTGAVPAIQKEKQLGIPHASGRRRLEARTAETIAKSIMSQEQWEAFLRLKETNLIYTYPGVGRFRVNVYRQRGSIGMVFRRVKTAIPVLKDLGVPSVLGRIALLDRGLVLITGGAQSGRATTVASMLNHRNQRRTGHIVTLENPIRYLMQHSRSIVTQREIGVDTGPAEESLEGILFKQPDVVSVGEVTSGRMMDFCVQAAEAGRLVFGILHTKSVVEGLERVLNFFPGTMRQPVLNLLAEHLRMAASQRLVNRRDGGRTAALELLVVSPEASELIQRGDFPGLQSHIDRGSEDGTVSLNRFLCRLVRRSIIAMEEAIDNTTSLGFLQRTMREVEAEPIVEEAYDGPLAPASDAEAADAHEDFLPAYTSRRPLPFEFTPARTGADGRDDDDQELSTGIAAGEMTPPPLDVITPGPERGAFAVPSHATPASFSAQILGEEDLLGDKRAGKSRPRRKDDIDEEV